MIKKDLNPAMIAAKTYVETPEGKASLKRWQEVMNPPKPEMPKDVADFLETEFGKKVQGYFLDEMSHRLSEGYREAYQMLEEKRNEIIILEAKIEALKDKEKA